MKRNFSLVLILVVLLQILIPTRVSAVNEDNNLSARSNEVSTTPIEDAGKIEMTIGNPLMVANGVTKEIDPGKGTAPVITEGRTFLPIRAVIEEMGGTVGWDNTEHKLTIQWKEQNLELWIGKTVMRANGVERTLDVAPYVSDTGRTMLPLRFVGESLGCTITWEGATSSATIVYDMANPATDPDISNQQYGTSLWTGVWNTDVGMLLLTQTGNSVSGIYGEWGDSFELSGTINGNKLSGIIDAIGEMGKFELEIAQDGNLHGWYRPDTYEDWESSNEWTGVKVSDSFGNTDTAWGGSWYTDFGPMVLTQNGSNVSGLYRVYVDTPVFKIEGTASGATYRGRIQEREFQGTFEFTLESDGKSFTGQYRYDGENEWTEWNGLKKK